MSLELSNTVLEFIPVELDDYEQLTVLDLSDNPLEVASIQIPATVEQLNLSGSTLFGSVNFASQDLTHLILNDVTFDGLEEDSDVVSDLFALLETNSGITHLGLNGLELGFRMLGLFELLSLDLVSLELSNTGLEFLPQVSEFEELEVLILDDNELIDISPLFADLPSLNVLSLLGNEMIACDVLTALLESFEGDIDLRAPENCGVVQNQLNVAALSVIISLILNDEPKCEIDNQVECIEE